jgi:hypothetical protein
MAILTTDNPKQMLRNALLDKIERLPKRTRNSLQKRNDNSLNQRIQHKEETQQSLRRNHTIFGSEDSTSPEQALPKR